MRNPSLFACPGNTIRVDVAVREALKKQRGASANVCQGWQLTSDRVLIKKHFLLAV